MNPLECPFLGSLLLSGFERGDRALFEPDLRFGKVPNGSQQTINSCSFLVRFVFVGYFHTERRVHRLNGFRVIVLHFGGYHHAALMKLMPLF